MLPVNLTPYGAASKPCSEAASPPIPDASSMKLPPVRRSLPYTRDTYQSLPASARTPELDFLLLGKIPGGRQGAVGADAGIGWEFEEVFAGCLQHGELDALAFLWAESARDPHVSLLNLTLDKLDAATAHALSAQADTHDGLRFNLYPVEIDASAVDSLSALIRRGRVPELKLRGAGSGDEALPRVAAAAAGACHALTLITARFDERAADVFGAALAGSTSLKKLTLYRCDLGTSRGSAFIEGMQKNRSVAYLKIWDVPLMTGPMPSCAALLAKNTTLQQLEMTCRVDQAIDLNAVFVSAAAHPSLRSLALLCPESEPVLDDLSGLLHLLRSHCSLHTLKVDIVLKHDADYMRVAEALKGNTLITEFALKRYALKNAGVAPLVDDTLARNRAIASGELARKAGYAFDPEGRQANGMTDAGSVIADHLLRHSSSLAEFVDTMAAVELSIRELETAVPTVSSPAAQQGAAATSDSSLPNPSLS